MLVPHHRNPPISGIGYHWQKLQKHPLFRQEIFPRLRLSREKWEYACDPRYAFEWGRGAGGGTSVPLGLPPPSPSYPHCSVWFIYPWVSEPWEPGPDIVDDSIQGPGEGASTNQQHRQHDVRERCCEVHNLHMQTGWKKKIIRIGISHLGKIYFTYSSSKSTLLVSKQLVCSPPPPTPIESGGTYARSSSPETPYLGKKIYPSSRVLVTTPFPGFSREIFPRLRPTNTLLPEEMGTHMRPPYAFEWVPGYADSSKSTPRD